VGGQWVMDRGAMWRRGLPILVLLWALCQPALLWTGYRLASTRFDRSTHSAPRDEAAHWILPWKQNDTSTTDWIAGVQRKLDPTIPIRADATVSFLLKINGHPTAPRNELPESLRQTYWSIRYPIPTHWQVVIEYPALRLVLIEREHAEN
jgi:hypothetical protein